RLRAFDPFPGATAQLGGETLKCWAGRVQPGAAGAAPGTVLAADAAGLAVATGEGVLLLTELQRAGGKRLPAATLLAGFAVQPGQVLG
ncbi:MAG TPA: methionyl-tRNA formyltransferase, partial [Pseudorhodoferax sp.]|nr:methionyl-tRNA formyltransferase [Pseudorhodoferax sp.]